jgi:ribosomal-protein-alanine N-acetyltransferase
MTEALRAAIDQIFEHCNLHRIMANYMPANIKSAQLLARLEFSIEGEAKQYLFINGKWEDHIMTSLINKNWKA